MTISNIDKLWNILQDNIDSPNMPALTIKNKKLTQAVKGDKIISLNDAIKQFGELAVADNVQTSLCIPELDRILEQELL